jgi:hypothetical protein
MPEPRRAPGYLVVANDVAPGAEAAFERWYQGEHLAERLSVPGFRNARRYVATEGAPRYAALYETDDTGVLSSDPYRARLEAPTGTTRSIMPSFRNMNRTVMQCDYHGLRGVGVLLDLVTVERGTLGSRQLAELLDGLAGDPAFEGLVLLSSVRLPPVSGTAEGKLRSAPDASIGAAALVHWADLPGHRPFDPRPLLTAVGLRAGAGPDGRYRLLTARGRFDLQDWGTA